MTQHGRRMAPFQSGFIHEELSGAYAPDLFPTWHLPINVKLLTLHYARRRIP